MKSKNVGRLLYKTLDLLLLQRLKQSFFFFFFLMYLVRFALLRPAAPSQLRCAIVSSHAFTPSFQAEVHHRDHQIQLKPNTDWHESEITSHAVSAQGYTEQHLQS
jgi:hypothetical protein